MVDDGSRLKRVLVVATVCVIESNPFGLNSVIKQVELDIRVPLIFGRSL